MKRFFAILVAGGLTACTTPTKDQAATADENEATRDVAQDDLKDYKGEPGNFVYKYEGKRDQLKDVIGGLPPINRSKEFKFLKKLSAERLDLLKNNLFDTGVDPDSSLNCAKIMETPHRTPTGVCYFHEAGVFEDKPRVGDKDQRFGRNISPDQIAASAKKYDVMDPNPREISRKLFTRKGGKTREADIINVLAAAWLQAQNHDWFTHGKNAQPSQVAPLHIARASGDREFPKGMNVPATQPDRTHLPKNGYEKTFRNHVTHWWDASQIYGSDQATIQRVRTNPLTGKSYDSEGALGHIAVDTKNRRLFYDKEGLPITGFTDNWWLGLELIHSLFAMEHNAIADRLKAQHPDWTGDQIFEKARLIVAALIAKIHTVEWTPALLDNKVLHVGMYSNWYGLRSAAGIDSPFLRGILDELAPRIKHAISGLVGPKTLDLYDVPFTLTEEFVAVYRMHPLVPETVTAKALSGKVVTTKPTQQAIFRTVPGLIGKTDSTLQWMYGLGTTHPGGLLLHNYPTFMQNIKAERNLGHTNAESNSVQMDLGAVDILRDRERQVPRYNDFRRSLRLEPITRFEDLTDDAEDVKILKEVYGDRPEDVEKLDLIVGTLAEKDRYAGFAFGNTPFYVFSLMASRRLMADPFFSDYYTPEVYTKFGIDWVEKESMVDVITRHYPELKPKFAGVTNAFRPWQPVFNEKKNKYAPGN